MGGALRPGTMPDTLVPHLIRHPLTLDRALRLDLEPGLLPLLAGWAPVAASSPLPAESPADVPDGAVITVVADGDVPIVPPAEEPHVRVDRVACWVDDDAARAQLVGAGGGRGVVDLATRRARIVAPPHAAGDAPAAELRAMCTIAAALLLGRHGSTLVAATAVIAPDGGGWLLVGDASTGKSTTAANLITAGWSYLADEAVMLHAGAKGSVWLEGWPRALALDEGWQSGRNLLRRASVHPSVLGRGRWRRTAPLAGLLFTHLAPELPTALSRASEAEALTALVRATPWLLADRVSSRFELGVLRSASHAAAWHLRLGRDTYADVVRLTKCLRPLDAA